MYLLPLQLNLVFICSSGISRGFIILIAVGGAILVIGIIVMLAILFVRSRRRNERSPRIVEPQETKERPYWIKDNNNNNNNNLFTYRLHVSSFHYLQRLRCLF